MGSSRLQFMLDRGLLQLQSLSHGEGGSVRSRSFARLDVVQLALSHARGMASLLAKGGRRVVLLDLEEEGEGEEDEEGEEGEEEEGEVGADAAEADDSHGEDMAMEEEDD